MVKVIKLRGGLDLHLRGAVKPQRDGAAVKVLSVGGEYGIDPRFFVGVKPKVVVSAGEAVKVGDALFVAKGDESVRCVSPVSGEVLEVVRGDRRKLLSIRIKADEEQKRVNFGKRAAGSMSAEDVLRLLGESGLMMYINQLPYAVVTKSDALPKGIFISAFRDMPLECAFEEELRGEEEAWQAGLTALSKVARTYVGVSVKQSSKALLEAKDVEVTLFDGRCPAGNVGVQVNKLDPVNKGEVVWTVDPTVVLFIGRLLLTGELDFTRRVALCGSEVKSPCYIKALVGTPLSSILEGQIDSTEGKRIINGNPLTGTRASLSDYLGAHTSCVCVIPEGERADELLGWIRPRLKDFSTSRSYFSWLSKKDKEYCLDARIKGGERKMIMSGEYDRVLPMDIYGEYLIKSIISGNIDRQEALGIYEVSPEDFAMAEFICSSKLPLQKIVREGLDILRKENE